MVHLPTCPICRKSFDPMKSAAMPFCSERCRRIDLARWAEEKYALPSRSDEDLLDEETPDREEPAGGDAGEQ